LQDHDPDGKEQEWTILLSRTKVGPHAEHLFAVEEEGVQGKVFTHVRLTIYPGKFPLAVLSIFILVSELS
jgi:allantoicase